jgi:hypothetical protein
MKKQPLLLTLIAGLLFSTAILNAQEKLSAGIQVITGGNMENADDWTAIWRTDTPDPGDTIIFNYTDDVPAQGAGGCLRVTGQGQCGATVFQEVTLKPRHIYSFDCAFKNISAEQIASTWVEFILSKTAPTTADYYPLAGDFRFQLNTWAGADTLNFDGLISERFGADGDYDMDAFALLPTENETTWYIVIKFGCWNTAGQPPAFDFLFDNMNLQEIGVDNSFPIENVIAGEVTDAADFTGNLDMVWDADSVYMTFDIMDDSIYLGATNVYEDDNIEVYFDMDNSKNPLWPRNAGWPNTSYDTNDYQLRLVPESDFSVNNSLEGVRQVYTVTEDGYQFNLHIAWDSLMAGFDAAAGSIIGFDVLASDNDADNGRNQITWNSTTIMPWNDASYFGTVELLDGGSFMVIEDTEKPTAPVIAAELNDAGRAVVTWNASTDNIAVLTYGVYMNNELVATKYATAVDAVETYNSAILTEGSYNIKVIAKDNSGNTATSNTVAVTVEGEDALSNITSESFSIYPNPAKDMVTITTLSNSMVELEVYSITGGLISSHVFTNRYELDMSEVNPGMYVLQLRSEGKVSMQKLVVE